MVDQEGELRYSGWIERVSNGGWIERVSNGGLRG